MPSWAKDIKIGSKLINARSETILEKPSFRKAAITRRALIPAEGYFEWQKTEDGKKIPHYLYSEKDELLAFASLYEFWLDPSLPEDDPGKWLLSCTVLTTTAHDTLGHVHDRAPVIIPPGMFADWLDPDTRDKTKVQELLDSVPEPVLTPRIVSDRVNSVREQRPRTGRAGRRSGSGSPPGQGRRVSTFRLCDGERHHARVRTVGGGYTEIASGS